METAQQWLNKCPLRYGCDFKYVNLKHRLEMDILSIWINITLECIAKYFENKTLVHVMAYCHYLNDVDLDLCRHIMSPGHNELINLWFVAFYWQDHMDTIPTHYNDVIMDTIASQITSLAIVYSTGYSDADQRKHQSSVSLAFVWGIHRGPMNSPHKWPVTRKMFRFDDVIMKCLQQFWSHALPC